MKLRQTTSRPLFRSLAAVVLLCWVTAVAVCSTRCLHESSDAEHLEPASATHGESHDPDQSQHHDDSFCTSLHALALNCPGAIFVKPDFGLAFTTDLISTKRILAVVRADAPVSRQPPDRESLLTPEVYLGPAFRSHAPPSALI